MLIEYSTLGEAKAAIAGANNMKLLDQTIYVDYAFVRPPPSGKTQSRGGRGGAKARDRSRSPEGKEDD